MELLYLNDETILIVTLYGDNRSLEVTDWHKRVMVEHFGLPVNYLKCPFPEVSHGFMMNHVLKKTVDDPNAPNYYLWLDNDNIMLRREALELAYQQVRDKITIWGEAWTSNHKVKANGTVFHAYASQACLMFSRQMYLDLGRPDMDHFASRSDTAEEATFGAKYKGYNVSLLYPSYSVKMDTPLEALGPRYGMGNTYGPLNRPLWFHCSCAPHPRHVEVFTETCKMVIDNAFEGDNPARPYAYA